MSAHWQIHKPIPTTFIAITRYILLTAANVYFVKSNNGNEIVYFSLYCEQKIIEKKNQIDVTSFF